MYCGECEDRLVAKGLVDPERAPALAPPRVSARGPARAARTETAPAAEEGFSEETERMLKARRRSRLALLEAQLALVKRMEGRRTAGGAECDAASDEPAREQPGEVPEAKDSERAEPEDPRVLRGEVHPHRRVVPLLVATENRVEVAWAELRIGIQA